MAGIDDARSRYLSWWEGKYCRVAKLGDGRGVGEFKKVVDVICYGPPSFVYGSAELVYEDGSRENITTPDNRDAFRPRKKDVEVQD